MSSRVATLRTTAKLDRAPQENEDSVAADPVAGRFAISDGASTSARPDVWSRLLAQAFVDGHDPFEPGRLAKLRRAWWDSVFTADLPWFAQEKLATGAAATFAGLRLHDHHYEVVAVGDSCVFHLRGEKILLAAPMTHWTQFTRFPSFVSTNDATPLDRDQLWSGGGAFAAGDVFVLATDAVAKHMLRLHAERGVPLPVPDHVKDDATFAEFVAQQREQGLDNDDSTVCVVRT